MKVRRDIKNLKRIDRYMINLAGIKITYLLTNYLLTYEENISNIEHTQPHLESQIHFPTSFVPFRVFKSWDHFKWLEMLNV